MHKKKVNQLLDVMQAYVNGKTIQYYEVDLVYKIKHPGEPNYNNKWVDVDEDHIFRPDLYDYRVKPEPNYRPFENTEECWQEMQKHQPFGWLKDKEDGHYAMVTVVGSGRDMKCIAISGNDCWPFNETMRDYTFADGSPFGILTEEEENPR